MALCSERSNILFFGARKRIALFAAALLAMFSLQAQASSYQFSGMTAVGSTAAAVAIPVQFTSAGTIASIRVLTGGIAQMDYANTGAGSCAVNAGYLTGQSCTVTVSFTPKAPGERRGAIVLLDSHGVPLGTTTLYAVGQGALGVLVPGVINTVAGSGGWLYAGDNGPATSAQIFLPLAVVTDAAGNLFIADSSNNRVRKVIAGTGVIETVAGNGNAGFSGDNGPATSAMLNNPAALALDGAGNLYIADSNNDVVRVVNAATGIITTVAGSGGQQGRSGDGAAATLALLNTPDGLAFDAAGNLYISDTGNNVVREVNTAGTISTFAGSGAYGYSGDGHSATAAALNSPWGLATSPTGDVYIADLYNNVIRKVNASGTIVTVAGTGQSGFSGDGQSATAAALNNPAGIAVDVAGNLYIADAGNNRVRKVNALSGNISTIGGTGGQSFTGDGGGADQAGLYGPYAVTLDGLGNLYVADIFHNRIREIASTQAIQAYPAMRVGRVSIPQAQGFENDGNANLSFTSISGVTNGAVDPATTTCSSTTPLAQSTGCIVGAEFAPTQTGKAVMGSIAVATNAANTPGTIQLTGEVETLEPTVITLATSGNPVALGAAVTFTIGVTSNGTAPTGTVQFLDGTTVIGTATLNASGVATFTTTSLAPGQHTITASYQGDGNSLTSSSGSVTETVQAVTTVTLGSSADPSSAGATVKFTATVTATGSNSSTGTLSGAVTFSDGSTVLGSGTLNGAGVATLSTATLALGGHSITASYAGSTYYASSTSAVLTQTVQQATTATMLSSSANPSIVNAAITLTATVSGNGAAPTGAVTFKDGTAQIGQATLNGSGHATITISTLDVSSHSITASYAGDTNNVASTSTAMTQVVQKATTATALAATPNPSSQGVYVQFAASVTGNGTAPTGTVAFMEGTTTLGTATLGTSGIATWSTNSLSMGQHTIVAVYQGDGNNNISSSASLLQNVLPATAIALTSNRNPGIAGAAITLTATVSGQSTVPTGAVTFKDSATVLGTASLNAQGVATLTAPALNVGAHSITASYAGDAANASSTSAVYLETMQQATSQTSLTTTASTITRGSSLTLTATVTGNGGTPGGSVAFMDNTTTLGTVALNAQGTASVTSSALTVGQHALSAVYAGDTNDAASSSTVVTETVGQASPSMQINSGTNPSLAGTGVTFTMALQNGVETPAGTVTWYDGTTVLGTSTVSGAASSFTANGLSVGQHAIKAVYSGDANNAPVTSGVLTQTVQQGTTTAVQSNANQSVAGANIHFSATVTGGSGNAVTGTVTFKDGANSLGTGVLTNGTAVFDTTTLTVGLHAITAVYSGDGGSQASTSAPWTQSVTAAATTVALTTGANPSVLGAAVTLTAVVSGNGVTATGAVTFKDGSVVLGMANLNGGVATYTATALAAGQHSLTAVYAGDSDNQAATSAALTQTVQMATATALVSSTNPALTAQTLTLTATVTNGGASAATGVVTFKDGATVIGTAALDVQGTATLQLASLSAGQHTLTASYGGDTLDIVSTSAAVTETVQLRATTISLADSGSTISAGQQLTLFAAVAGVGPVDPTGTVTFYSGSTAVGTATLSGTGVATLNFTPASGTYTITAQYAGDTVYAASTATALGTITVGQSTTQFTVTPNPSAVTVASKQHSTINISLQSVAAFADTMEMGCLGLPSGATCTFSTTTVTLAAGATQTVQVTLDTADPIASGAQAKVETVSKSTALACGLPAGVLMGLLLWGVRRNRRAMGALVMLALTALTIGLGGCGALQINGVAPGTYNVKVVATGNKTGITQSATVTLTVTQ